MAILNRYVNGILKAEIEYNPYTNNIIKITNFDLKSQNVIQIEIFEPDGKTLRYMTKIDFKTGEIKTNNFNEFNY